MTQEETHISVSEYVDLLNTNLKSKKARILGEVIQLQLYPERSYLFFSLKDKETEAVINCMMWKRDYIISGIQLEDGLEVIVSGHPEIYKPSGRLTLMSKTVELVGEGALKKAYEKLKSQLEKEGLFNHASKRALPIFPKRIGVITSRDGAVINDFLSNIGRHGFEIKLINSRVEGQLATEELIASVKSFRNKEIDILVIIRGGGSMESLLPFNNEILVREIASFPVPVIAGIGHDKDVTLVALAADKMVSTPTAVTAILNESWDKAHHRVNLWESKIFTSFNDSINKKKLEINNLISRIKDRFQEILHSFSDLEFKLKEKLLDIKHSIGDLGKTLDTTKLSLFDKFRRSKLEKEKQLKIVLEKSLIKLKNQLQITKSLIKIDNHLFKVKSVIKQKISEINSFEKQLILYNPERQLKLGYSIISSANKIIKSINNVNKGDIINIRLQDGSVESEIK